VKPRLVAREVHRAALTRPELAEMLSLMRHCYEGVSAERFETDLRAKDRVILLESRHAGELRGFTTIRMATERLGHRAVDLVYSGDTVVHPDYWGTRVLQSAFARFLLRRKLRRPWRPCYWLLLSGGYKTYLLMVRNLPRSIPRRGAVRDPRLPPLLDRIARSWFGSQYDDATGVVRFDGGHYHVRSNVAVIDARTASHPDVAYYLSRNPGHSRGDELVCLAEMRAWDLGRALARAVVLGWRWRAWGVARPRAARTVT
jgi:hypothetical protein